MKNIPFEVIGFDLDGTLLDTSFELAEAVNFALEGENRRIVGPTEIRPVVGHGARGMILYGLLDKLQDDDPKIEMLRQKMVEYYEENIGSNSPTFPGVIDMLNELQEADIILAVVTNKSEQLALKLLSEVGMIDRFRTIIGGDSLGPGRSKPLPDTIQKMLEICGRSVGITKACFIGDSMFDVQAAKNAGIPSIVFRHGFLDRPAEELGADAIIDHFDDLIETLKRPELKTTR